MRKASASGGALIDHGIYYIAQMLHLLGNTDVRTVSGMTYQEIDMYEDMPARTVDNVFDELIFGKEHPQAGEVK